MCGFHPTRKPALRGLPENPPYAGSRRAAETSASNAPRPPRSTSSPPLRATSAPLRVNDCSSPQSPKLQPQMSVRGQLSGPQPTGVNARTSAHSHDPLHTTKRGAHSATRSDRCRGNWVEPGSSGHRSWSQHRRRVSRAQSGNDPAACRKYLKFDCPVLSLLSVLSLLQFRRRCSYSRHLRCPSQVKPDDPIICVKY